MPAIEKSKTVNIRIHKDTHERLKDRCALEGRLLGAYVNSLLLNSIEEVEKKEKSEEEK